MLTLIRQNDDLPCGGSRREHSSQLIRSAFPTVPTPFFRSLICCCRSMARLRTTRRAGEIRIAFAGRLTADDMGRLERACAEALTHDPVRLHLDLARVTELDETARALVESLQRRGAIVVRERARNTTQQHAEALATPRDTIRSS